MRREYSTSEHGTSQKQIERKSSRRRRRSGSSFARRFTTGIAAVLLVMVCSFGFGSFFSSAHDSLKNEPQNIKCYKSIEIEAGDSVWSIAEEYMGDEYSSIYEYMDELVSLNQIDNTELDCLQEGDYLMVSYYNAAE